MSCTFSDMSTCIGACAACCKYKLQQIVNYPTDRQHVHQSVWRQKAVCVIEYLTIPAQRHPILMAFLMLPMATCACLSHCTIRKTSTSNTSHRQVHNCTPHICTNSQQYTYIKHVSHAVTHEQGLLACECRILALRHSLNGVDPPRFFYIHDLY